MQEAEAIDVLRACNSLYQNLRFIPCYELKAEELETLCKFKKVYDSGLFQDPEVLKASDFKVCQLGLLVGYMAQLV